MMNMPAIDCLCACSFLFPSYIAVYWAMLKLTYPITKFERGIEQSPYCWLVCLLLGQCHKVLSKLLLTVVDRLH